MSWRTVKLAELVENFSVRAKDVGGAEGLDFYGVSNEDGIIKTKYAAEDKAEDYKIIEKGCFAYNPYRVNVGSIGLVSDDTRGLISPAYVIFKPKPKSIIPELLFKFLKSAEGLRQIIFYARGTVRQALRFEDLCNIEISIPDYSEQQGLYNKLINSQKSSNILDAELKNQLELLKKLRQQLLQDAVQGKLVEQNKNDEPASELLKKIKIEKKLKKELPPLKPAELSFEIPSNWIWCRLGDIAEIVRGGSPRPAGDPTFYGGAIPFLKVGDLTGYEDIYVRTHTYSIKEAGLHKTRFVEADTLMLTNSGATLGIPRICTFPTTFNDGIAAFLNLNNIDKVYLYYFLKSKSAWYLKEASRGQGQPNLNTDIIALTPFPLPPLNEQKRIVEKLEQVMQNCNDLEESIKHSESQNEKLLQQVLREALRKEPVEV